MVHLYENLYFSFNNVDIVFWLWYDGYVGVVVEPRLFSFPGNKKEMTLD